jgi:pimeloyl-ACP methyl ester carboxylesterase
MHLYYQSQGQGQPLIIIHGLFGSSDNWRSMAKFFSKWFTVINVDLRNHGRSFHAESQRFDDMANDIYQLCQQLGLSKVHLLGHSLGGKTAMKFTELCPDLVDKLIVVDVAPRQYQGEHTPMMDAMLALDFSNLSSRSDVDKALAEKIPDKAVRQFLMMNLMSENETFKWRINLPALKANYIQYMKPVCEEVTLEHRSLFIYGEQSDYVSALDRQDIKTRFPNSRFQALPTGHWVHAERPQQFKRCVEAFLND